ncbi:hypothetical protein U2P60_02755 [Brucella sp. H1_1004]|uniref:hypothetical protein n=1 Tax=Brucella sp. H1_1004 TaxID=3110109 RepID=UPI0039B4547B
MKEALSAKVQIMIEPSLIKQIDDWRFTHRVSSRSHAMRELLKTILRDEKAKGPATAPTVPSQG